MKYVRITICLHEDRDRDVIGLLEAAPNNSDLVRMALRAYEKQPPDMKLLLELYDQIRALREELGNAPHGKIVESDDAVAALDDILVKLA